MRLLDDCLGAGAVHHAPDADAVYHTAQHALVVTQAQRTENLAGLFLQRHGGEGLLDPLDALVVEEKGIGSQIYHVSYSFIQNAFSSNSLLVPL